MISASADPIETIDRFLADCVRRADKGLQAPHWPSEYDQYAGLLCRRVSFHGVAVLILPGVASVGSWPDRVSRLVQDEARLQAFWEADHRRATRRLLEAFHAAAIKAAVMKGTALAYSIYSDPAVRRRGDTDLLIENASRRSVRKVLRDAGFFPSGDPRALQEPWAIKSPAGLVHEIDVHWAVNASMTVARMIESDHPRSRLIDLPRLYEHTPALGPIDNFLLTCINRQAHREFGYRVENARLFEGDRLIWALDLHRLANDFSEKDWDQLADIARRWRALRSLASGVEFARSVLGTEFPDNFIRSLPDPEEEIEDVSDYLANESGRTKLRREVASAPGIGLKLALLKSHLLPGRAFMRARYPGSERWPLAALWARRLLDAGSGMMLGRKR